MKVENIKFKAKRLDNGEWVEGSLISTAGIKERAYIVDNFSSMSDYSVIGVDPSTVCQFTGLKDCNGKEVWEGDIVSPPLIREAFKIEWDKFSCGFISVDNTGYICSPISSFIRNSNWVVIGNKFDKEK